MKDKKYSSSLTGAGLRHHEFKEVVKLIDEGLNDDEIRSKVINENLFQEKTSSTQRSFPYILNRARVLDKTLRQWVLEETVNFAKVINFYAILKTDHLFLEFMDEVIKVKLKTDDFIYEKKDLNIFFNEKIDQDEKLRNWNDSTIGRLKGSYNRLLLEMGYLDDLISIKLNRIFMDERLKKHLVKIGDKEYIEIMGG